MSQTDQEAAARIDQLIALTERLTEVVAGEAKAIEAQDHAAIAGFREESVRLTQAYQQETAQVRAEPGLLNAAPAERRARLIRSSQAFEGVLAHQQRVIVAAKTVTEGLLRALAAHVVAQRSPGAGYGPTARPPASSAHLSTAVALNQRA